MSKYTTGKWKFVRDYDYVEFYAGKNMLFQIKDNMEGNDADYKLMMAAPDLLEALQNILNGIQAGDIKSDMDETFAVATQKAIKAIKKATGAA